MRRLVTSDWQLCDNARDRYRTDFVAKELPKLIQKHGAEQLLVLGDLTEEKDYHPASLVNEVVDIFKQLSQLCEIVILQGNHDFLNYNHPFFNFLVHLDRISWIARPTQRDNCLFLPHTRDYKKDWAGLTFANYDYIFAHNIFEGVKANGQKLSGIPTNIFPDAACVIAGDVHEPQTFDVVTYVGSPCLCDFGDNYQPRVLLLDGSRIKSIKVHGPQKRVIECDWDNEESIFHGTINKGDIVKIKVNLQMKHVAEWDKIRNLVQDWGVKRNLIVNTIQPIVEYVVGDRAKPIANSKKTDLQYLEQFAKRAGLADKTVALGKEIIDLI